MSRIKAVSLPPGYVAQRATASGRTGVKRWEIYTGTEVPVACDWRDQNARWCGDIAFFSPENEWVFQAPAEAAEWHPAPGRRTSSLAVLDFMKFMSYYGNPVYRPA